MCPERTSKRDEMIVLGSSLFTVFVTLFTVLWS